MKSSNPVEQNKQEKVSFTTTDKMIIFLSLACIAYYLTCSAIGVIRGFSVQTRWPQIIGLAGFLFLIAPSYKFIWHNQNHPFLQKLSLISSLFMIYMMLPEFFQGRYYQSGDELFKQRNYSAALAEYQKEIDTWFLRLKYNHTEAPSMYRTGQCYAQLGDFDKAREIYQKTADCFHGHYRERAVESLDELDAILPEIKNHQKMLASLDDDGKKANLLFDIALLYRRLECDQKAVEQYNAIQKLNTLESSKELALKFAQELKKPGKF